MAQKRRTESKWMGYKAAAALELAALLPRQVHTLYCIAEEKKKGGGVGGWLTHTHTHTYAYTNTQVLAQTLKSFTSLSPHRSAKIILVLNYLNSQGWFFFFKTVALNKEICCSYSKLTG